MVNFKRFLDLPFSLATAWGLFIIWRTFSMSINGGFCLTLSKYLLILFSFFMG